MPQIIPIRDLKSTSDISALCQNTEEPIFITKNGYGHMVVMSMEVYEKNLFMQDVYVKLDQADREIAEGKTMEAFPALEALRKKHGI